jgi:hypothetical protein
MCCARAPISESLVVQVTSAVTHLFHHVQHACRTHQPRDTAIVSDRSGTMSLPTSGSGTRLDAAKEAAELFVVRVTSSVSLLKSSLRPVQSLDLPTDTLPAAWSVRSIVLFSINPAVTNHDALRHCPQPRHPLMENETETGRPAPS